MRFLSTARKVLGKWRHPQRPTDPMRFRLNSRVVQIPWRFAGHHMRLFLRPGTTDQALIPMILQADGMYRLPSVVQPRVIFDIGANIGIATVYFASIYPQAVIYCFEPLATNIELLRANTEAFGDRVRVMNYGLSDVSATMTYHMSDNPQSFGGGGFCAIGHDPQRQLELPVRAVRDALGELGLSRVDLFKIDTEGSELNILRAMPLAVRQEAQAFIGELHGIGDWEFCRTLEASHAVGIHKRWENRCFPFIALRRDLLSSPSIAVTRRAA